MEGFNDYYAILGVAEDASDEEIKRAYRRLARKYHPDVSVAEDAEARFKEVGEAYEVLKDPEKRAHYDQVKAHGGTPPPGAGGDWQFSGGGFTDADAAQFSEFFHDLFGGGFEGGARRNYRSYQSRGEDLRAHLALTLEEAYRGGEHVVHLRVPQFEGERFVQREKKLKVKVPAGVTDGRELRLRGQGAPGLGGGAAGDLYLTIRLAPHPAYVVEGKDIHLTVPVAPWEVVLGGKIEVPTLGGRVKVSVPRGERNLRLKGRGMPGDPPGDQYLHFDVTLPSQVGAEELEHWQALAAASREDVRAGWRV